jgi:hypothetical protein
LTLRLVALITFLLLGSLKVFGQAATDLYMEESKVVNAPQSVFGSVSLMETMGITASSGDTTSVGGNVEYEFYKSYGVGLDANYRQPYMQDFSGYNGWGDAVLYLTDRKLYTSKPNRFDVSDRLNFIVPFSSRSMRSSLESGVSGELRALKGLGKWSVMLGTELGNYYYQYDTIDSITQLVYNAPLVWGNRFVVIYNFNRSWHWNSAASVRASYDYAAATHTQDMVTTGIGWDVNYSYSLNAGVRTIAGNMPGGGSGGDTNTDTVDPTTQNSTAQPHLFDASSTSFYFGLRVRL